MKKIIIIILSILFFIMPFVGIENKSNFEFFIIIWPIVAIIFIIIKIKNFNKINFKKAKSMLNENKIKDLKEDNSIKKEEGLEIKNNPTEK